jgi:hypothetical protein
MITTRERYMEELARRAKESHIYKKYQLTGLQIADILEDRKHKALYIKLAKERDPEQLLAMAKSVAENKNVKNKGAYFMVVLKDAPRPIPGKRTYAKRDPHA